MHKQANWTALRQGRAATSETRTKSEKCTRGMEKQRKWKKAEMVRLVNRTGMNRPKKWKREEKKPKHCWARTVATAAMRKAPPVTLLQMQRKRKRSRLLI